MLDAQTMREARQDGYEKCHGFFGSGYLLSLVCRLSKEH